MPRRLRRHLVNRHAFPVLVGDGNADAQRAALVLSSPIILYDFPGSQHRPKPMPSTRLEIDELIMLCVLSLSDAERPKPARPIRAPERSSTGPSARSEALARLHAGSLQRSDEWPAFDGSPSARSSGSTSPAFDCVFVEGVSRHGCERPAASQAPRRRWDLFLDGKLATVRAIHQDFEDQMYVAVTVDDDPGERLARLVRPLVLLLSRRGRAGSAAVPEVRAVKLLVAGIGNIFFGDDGFGCRSRSALAAEPAPEGVTIDDFGIRGLHLGYELLAGYDRAFLIDASRAAARRGRCT